jgi:hypothetical protein
VSAQSFTRRHPLAVDVASAVFIVAFVPSAMAVQGFPPSLFLSMETLPKLILVGVLFGGLMTGCVLLIGRASDAVEPRIAPYKKLIWLVSIATAVLMFYFIVR